MGAPDIDNNAYEYGGAPGGAAAASGKYQGNADASQGRAGEQIDTGNSDQSRAAGGDARGAQLRMSDMMARRAMGQTPSIAGMQADRQMGQVAAEQSSAAASARGPAALALAQQQGAANTAAAQSSISGQAQINAANERMQAEQAATGAYSNLRQGDMSQQGIDAQQAQAQAQMNAAQRAQNDQYTLGSQAQAIGVNTTQMQGQMNRDAAAQSQYFNQQNLEMQAAKQDQDTALGWAGVGASVVGSIASMSDERSKVPVSMSTWGTGSVQADAPDTSQIDMARMSARQALADQHGREAAGYLQDQQTGGGPMAVDGMDALYRRDQEDLGLMQAKQRNGLELTDREQSQQSSLTRRMGTMKATAAGGDKAAAAPPPDGKDGKAAPKKEVSTGDAAAAGFQGIGKALTSMRGNAGPSFQYVPPTQYQMTSDEDTKDVVPLRDERDGRGEQHDDRDVSKSKADVVSGASLSGPTPKYSMASRLAPAKREDAAPKKRKLTDAELDRMAAEMDRYVHGQSSAQLGKGPAVQDRMTSDSDAKKAAIWDQGHNAALAELQDMRSKSPDELKALGTKGNRLANALRGAKGDAYDEAQGRGGSIMNVPKDVHVEPNRDEHIMNVPPGLRPEPRAPREMQSFARGAEPREQVGSLGEEMPREAMAEAARSLKAVPYAYKPGFDQSQGQTPGEVNVGPVAQEMQKSPVAATAVKQDGPDGMRSIDIPKYTKVLGGIAASQQEQLDDQKRQIASMAQLLRSKR